jgi:hypothetical protein
MKSDGSRITVFRAYFHTNFIENNHLRLEKRDLDDAYVDRRVPTSFTFDLYFLDEEPPHESEPEIKAAEDEPAATATEEEKTDEPAEAAVIDKEAVQQFEDELESEEDETNYDEYIEKLEKNK